MIAGTDPVPLGSNNSGRGVGGSMVHYAGYTPRFHPSDFRTYSQDGVGADWPIEYADLQALLRGRSRGSCRSPGRTGRGATRTPTRTGRTRSAGNGEIFLRGAPTRSASRPGSGPVAIANGRFGNRPHCIYRGFCLQGCKVNAKASPLITHIPDALAHGAEVRADSMVTRVEVDERTGRATGRALRARRASSASSGPRIVAVAGYSIETPRLLLQLRPRRGSPTGCATTSTRSAAT